jgi:hypothetical protein
MQFHGTDGVPLSSTMVGPSGPRVSASGHFVLLFLWFHLHRQVNFAKLTPPWFDL